MKNFEAIVVGSGAMGSSTAHHLARRGVKTLALERFSLNHANGSSHGRTRIIRYAYDHPWYIPLAMRASELWLELQRESGREIMRTTGGLFVGPADHDLFKTRIRNAESFGAPHRMMSREQVADQYPAFNLSEGESGYYDPNAGILFPETCIESHVRLAEGDGAEFHFDETVTNWERVGEKVVVRTSRDSYSTDKLVISAGGWTKGLVPGVDLPLMCERQVVFWMKPLASVEIFGPKRMPVFGWFGDGEHGYYGVPDLGDGVKVARDHAGAACSPENVERSVTEEDERPVRHFLSAHMPLADGELRSSTTCIYTNTPDLQFLLDSLPNESDVLLVSPCSGHGFKFSSVVGEIVSDLVTKGSTRHDISQFRVGRFNF